MDAITRVPVPVNEPVRLYQPGSADRAIVEARIKELAGQRADLTMTIGGRQGRGGAAASGFPWWRRTRAAGYWARGATRPMTTRPLRSTRPAWPRQAGGRCRST